VTVARAMRTLLLALSLALLAPPAAFAAVDRPGVAEIRQDGTRVTYTAGLHHGPLDALADDAANNLRVVLDGASCPGGLKSLTPATHAGERYVRAVLVFSCPQTHGTFEVVNEFLLDSAVDYALGGTSGTFRFGPDRSVLKTSSPVFSRWLEEGFERITLGWAQLAFLALVLLGARSIRELAALGGVVTAGQLLALAAATTGVIALDDAVVDPAVLVSVVCLAALPVLGIGGERKLWIVGVLSAAQGLAIANDMALPGGASALAGLIVGLMLAQGLVLAVGFGLVRAIPARGMKPHVRHP
jgi:hypothetical protein